MKIRLIVRNTFHTDDTALLRERTTEKISKLINAQLRRVNCTHQESHRGGGADA